MTYLGPLLLLWLLGREHSGQQPAWPSRKSPPPRKATHPRAARKPKPSAKAATHAAATHAAATHPAAAQAVHAVHHQAEPEHAPHDHTMPVHTEHDSSEKGPDLSALNFGLRPTAAPRKPAHRRRAQHAAAADTHTAEPPSPAEGQYSVANVQSILRALGWRGHLTTHGPLSSDLTDGLAPKYENEPSVTRDDWQQSARKRSLDPTFIRVDSTTVHVDPETYAALRDVARSMGGNVVGIGGGRRVYIP